MIREATAADYAAFASLFRELGLPEPPPAADRWGGGLDPGMLMFERDGAVVGYLSCYKLARAGHVSQLAVAAGARRSGVGGALLAAAATRLRAAGADEWHLNVKADNRDAIRLYERAGFAVEYRSTQLRIAWASALALPGEAAAASRIAPADDAVLEHAFGLVDGRLARARMRPDRALVQLRGDDGASLGLAAFDPQLPGAYPFYVARPALAGTLLRALAPHAHTTDGELAVMIERDDALVAALRAAGARVTMELLHYRGAL
ncbi:MAG TPA: GNAT family N-acetyltransferase [Kofleriaceae bacterium]|nr:GNAT family N-acetyltransferase [Kofleriaceae bacterium]